MRDPQGQHNQLIAKSIGKKYLVVCDSCQVRFYSEIKNPSSPRYIRRLDSRQKWENQSRRRDLVERHQIDLIYMDRRLVYNEYDLLFSRLRDNEF